MSDAPGQPEATPLVPPPDVAPVTPPPDPIPSQAPSGLDSTPAPDPVPTSTAPPATLPAATIIVPDPALVPPPPSAPAPTEPVASTAAQKDTDVTQEVIPIVTHETVDSTEADVDKTVVEKDIHKDIYHTTVQTIIENKQLPEQVYNKVAPTEERSFDDRGDPKELEQHLAEDASKFKDERIVNETKHVHTVEPTVTGEHIHYHVHERIQPIVQRETIQPTVVHTTMPLHETYHEHPHYTTITSLPPVSMSDFQKHGGNLSAREPYHDHYEGKPRSDSGEMEGTAQHLYQKDA